MIELAQWVLAVAHATHRTREGHAVFFIYGHGGRHLQGVLQRLAVNLIGVGDGKVLTNSDEFVHLVAGVDTSRQTLKVGVLEDTVGFLVAERNQGRGLLGGVRDRKVVVLSETRARDFIEPVGVAEAHGLARIDEAIVESVHRIVNILTSGRIIGADGRACRSIQVQTIVGSVGHGVEAIVEGSLGHRSGILGGIGQLHHGLRVVELGSEVGREVHLHLVALLARAGGDDDHTICSTRTIDRCRGGILQYLHRLNIVHVERVEVGGRRHAIDNEEWVLRRVERTDTTDTYPTGTHRRTIACDGHAGNLSLQGTHGVGVGRGFQLIGLHHSHRTCKVGLTLCGITGDNNLGQFAGILFQRDVEVGSGGHLHGIVADIGNDQCLSRLNLQGEVTIQVGHGAVGCSFLHNGCADDTLSGLIDDSACNLCLRIRQGTCKHQHHAKKKSFAQIAHVGPMADEAHWRFTHRNFLLFHCFNVLVSTFD